MRDFETIDIPEASFNDRYGHRRAVKETDQKFRSIELKAFNDTIFKDTGQL